MHPPLVRREPFAQLVLLPRLGDDDGQLLLRAVNISRHRAEQRGEATFSG